MTLRISPSSLARYWRCGELYRRELLAKEAGARFRPTGPMIVGTACHAAAEFALKRKRDGVLVDPDAMLVKGQRALDSELEGHPDPMLRMGGGDEMVAKLYRFCKTYHKYLLPRIVPAEVELWMEVPLSSDVLLVGKLDVVDEFDPLHYLRDLKIADRGPDTDAMEKTAQMAIYQYMFQSIFPHREVGGVSLDFFVDGKRPHFTIREREAYTKMEMDAVRTKIDQTVAAIRASVYPPGEPYFICNPNKCDQWQMCRMGSGDERIPGVTDA
jgi:hypothetical protein